MDKLQLTDEKAGQRLRELIESSAEAVQTITFKPSERYAVGRLIDDFTKKGVIIIGRIVDDLYDLV